MLALLPRQYSPPVPRPYGILFLGAIVAAGAEGDVDAIQKFILDLFSTEKKELYPHFTTAIDTGNISFVFKSVKDTLIHDGLKEFNIM